MIRVSRIQKDIEAIAQFTHTPGNGASRPTFSPQWAAAVEYVRAELTAIDCESKFDGAGNVRARPTSLGWDKSAWLCGSHIDTVPSGGDYDGVTGIVVAIELLRSAKEDAIDALPVELIIFAEEEGPTFGLGMLGSRAMVGELSASQLSALRNSDGKTFLEAGAPFGVTPDHLHSSFANLRGLIEVHIEQGPAMWAENIRLAVVTAIAGRRQYKATFTGVPNHAGSTPMRYRADPLVAAARFIHTVDQVARESGEATVATVGRLECEPNAINVIPGEVRLTVDLRSPDRAVLDRVDRQLVHAISQCGVDAHTFLTTEDQPPVQMDDRLCKSLIRCSGGALPTTVSGALHDSAILVPHLPTAMLFIPSRDGISHNPAEFSRFEDIAGAAMVVERLVRRVSLDDVNIASRERFVQLLGPIFEKTPWIAERAHGHRPFESIARLHETMCDIVRQSPADAQLALVNAHPDLVGRLAREGRVTKESTAEQAAAGLDSLSEIEINTFDKYNAAYRAKFGFPFVICARQNRKEAILAAFPNRLNNSRETELQTALDEIEKIAELRLFDLLVDI